MIDDSQLKIDSDVGKDLVEQILGLFSRIRAFSYAKTIKEKHKLQSKKCSKRSLRTELKKIDENEP